MYNSRGDNLALKRGTIYSESNYHCASVLYRLAALHSTHFCGRTMRIQVRV